jgi:DNA-binding FadR family transcriptional regulator
VGGCSRSRSRSGLSPGSARFSSAGLWDRSDFYIRVAFGSLYFSRRVRRAHGTVRDAILEGRAMEAETAMREHLQAVGTAVAGELRKKRLNVDVR